jgi:hypothetical protein
MNNLKRLLAPEHSFKIDLWGTLIAKSKLLYYLRYLGKDTGTLESPDFNSAQYFTKQREKNLHRINAENIYV